MDKKKIKRVVAREGLIFLPFIVVFCYLLWKTLVFRYDWLTTNPANPAFGGGSLAFGYFQAYKDYLSKTQLVTACYLLYLASRFIIWAIKTLRER